MIERAKKEMFALGLAKTAVEGTAWTLRLIKSAVEEEAELKEKVQNDLVFISGEFEMMQSFLRIANKERIGNDEVVLTWVRQLRNLAFDVEDCVEYVVHLEIKSSCWPCFWRRVWRKVNCWAAPLPLDVAVAEIKQLKDRVQYVSQRSTRYKLHDSNNKNKQQPSVTAVMPPLAEQPPDATTYPSSAPKFHILRDAWEATGKWCNKDMYCLQELILTGDDSLQVISVWGSTVGDDLGTAASILTKAYWDPEICKEFKSRAWVKLTHPFNHAELVNTLLAQFYATSSQQANAGGVDFREEDKLAKLKQNMKEQRCLIVLENVLAVAEWNVIRMHLQDSKNGSRIVVSTPRLATALLCAGEPYQVLELTKFYGDNQILCAFFKNKMPSGEFYRRLRRDRVISVWGADGDDLVDILYKGIINGWYKEFEWVSDADKADRVSMLNQGISNRRAQLYGTVAEFKWHSWVDVPNHGPDHPLDLKVFARRLFLNFHSDDIRASKITEGGKMEKEGLLIEWCRESLFEKEDCLVVINGLQSMEDWELIKSNFFPSKATTVKAGCIIIVVTDEETVAQHCVTKDHTHLASFNATDLKADPTIDTLIKKGRWHYAIRGRKGRMFYDRSKDVREWAIKFSINSGPDEKEGFGVFTVTRNDKNYVKGVLRHAYYDALFQQQIESCSWVDLPRHETYKYLTTSAEKDLAWRLLLDFYSDDPRTKEDIAVGLMEGTITNPIQECREILCQKKCLVVIHGDLTSEQYWKDIKRTFFSDSEHIQSIIIVGSSDPSSNAYCSPSKVLRLGTQQEGFIDNFYKEFSSLFYTNRCQKARNQIPEPVGRHREVEELTRDVNDRHVDLVSVWGIAGVGKSTLVRTVYYQKMLYSATPKASFSLFDYSFEAFGWVDVPSPFNLIEFAWHLLLDLYSDDPQAKQTAAFSMMEEGQDPILECCKILQEIDCLVIIDGLCSTEDLDLIKATFLANEHKSTIVVITNEEKVAMHCVHNLKERVVNVRLIEADAARTLFCQKIAWDAEALDSARGMEVSKSVVAKCGKLPKVIATIGEVCKSRTYLLQTLGHNFMGTLETDREFRGLRPLLSWIQSYFDACSDSLKPCIFYLSIFSVEQNIRWRRLLWRFIAEGYCRDTSDGTTCEHNGINYIVELIKLSIIQVLASWESFVQINGFFHEYIISRPMEDNLVFALEKGCSLNSTRAGQHLTIRSTWDRSDKVVYKSIDFSRLRSLTVFGKWESFFICSKKVNMRLLRVLDLEDATDVTNEDLEKISKLLTRLKFLSLRGCREITRLPSSMGGLRQLQTLDVRDTSIATFPPVITKLQKLRYIRAGTTTEAWDWEGDIVAADGEENRASVAAEEGDIVLADGEENWASSSSVEERDIVPADGEKDRASLSTQEGNGVPGDGEDMASSSTQVTNLPPVSSNNLVSSLLSKLRRSSGGLDNNGPAASVKIPAGIKKLAVLHTLGVVHVKVTSSAKSIFFEELKKLTQLHKLGVSGINKENIHYFCGAISGHGHLTSLSVELDKDDNLDGLDDIPQPPNTIKSLKLYGRVNKLLVWIDKLGNNYLVKLKLDLTVEKPEELPELSLPPLATVVGRLRIRPIQAGDLYFRGDGWRFAQVVEIQCSSVLHIVFGNIAQYWEVGVLKVHFSGGSQQSSLKISWRCNLKSLQEVWLKGYTEAHKQDMRRQINQIPQDRRPVLKLVQTRSSS